MRNRTWLWVGVGLALVIGSLLFWRASWPINFIGSFAGLVTAAGLGLLAWSKPRGQAIAETIRPGEEEIYRFLRRTKRKVFQFLPLVLGGIILIGIGLYCYFGFSFPTNFILFVGLTISGVALTYFSGSPMIREMADLGWWFVRVPEMHVAFIESDNACHWVIMNVNDCARREHFQELANKRNRKPGPKYVLLPPGKGIYFLGLTAWPWRYRLKRPWYENSGDAENPKKEPFRFLDLMERSWNLLPESERDKNGVPGVVPRVGTHDPIDVDARLFVRLRVIDPYKAAYGTGFVGESIVSELTSRWRRVVANLYYFPEAEEGGVAPVGAYLKINPQIQEAAHNKFLIMLGLSKQETEKKNGKVYKVYEDNEQTIPTLGSRIDVENYMPQTTAGICRDAFGFEILDVEVRDLQPTKEVWDKLQAKTMAAAEGAAELAKAQGEAEAVKVRAEAEAEAIRSRASGEADAIGYRAWILQAAKASEVLHADVQRAVAKEADILFAGSGSELAESLTAGGKALQQAGVLPETWTKQAEVQEQTEGREEQST